MPRTAADAVSDLHTLLRVAKVPAPYVFVSHSLGGLIDRLYAATYPRQVAGMVLVDALAEYFQEPLDPAQMAAYSALNNGPVEGPTIRTWSRSASSAASRRCGGRGAGTGFPISPSA
jgi:pimeloyl-ACP methyl ester carboxylesterase